MRTVRTSNLKIQGVMMHLLLFLKFEVIYRGFAHKISLSILVFPKSGLYTVVHK